MKKRTIIQKSVSFVLVVTLICSLVPFAFAAPSGGDSSSTSQEGFLDPNMSTVTDNSNIISTVQDRVVDNSSNTVDAASLPHTPYNPVAPEDIPVERPIGKIIRDAPEDPMISYASAAVYGPYTQLETMADDKMQVIVYGLKNSGFSNAVKYGGYTCYKFSYNNKTVYVTTSTFYRQQKATVTRSVSDVSTTAINTGDSDKKYTTVIKSTAYTYNGMKVFHWSFARVGVRTYHAKNYSEIGMGVSVDQAYEFDAYYSGLQDISSAKMKITPTAAIRVTQSPNGLYFDSYEFRGKGDDTSKTSMGRIVEIAFLAKKAIGTVSASALTVGTIYSAFGEIVNLSKTNQSTRKNYLTDLIPLSSSKRYIYKFETPAPFPLRLAEDYTTMELGITYTGAYSSATRYNAYYGWTIT